MVTTSCEIVCVCVDAALWCGQMTCMRRFFDVASRFLTVTSPIVSRQLAASAHRQDSAALRRAPEAHAGCRSPAKAPPLYDFMRDPAQLSWAVEVALRAIDARESKHHELCAACFRGDDDLVQVLLDKGATPNSTVKVIHDANSCELGPVCACLFCPNPRGVRCLRLLLACESLDINSVQLVMPGHARYDSLMLACDFCKAPIVRILLEAGAGREHPVQDGLEGTPITPLMLACIWGKADVVQLLLDWGQSTKTVIRSGTFDGTDALDLALRTTASAQQSANVQAGAAKCARIILGKHKADDPAGFSAQHADDLLMYSMESLRFSSDLSSSSDPLIATKLLLDAGVDPNVISTEWSSNLFAADSIIPTEVLATLTNNGSWQASTPLDTCIQQWRFAAHDSWCARTPVNCGHSFQAASPPALCLECCPSRLYRTICSALPHAVPTVHAGSMSGASSSSQLCSRRERRRRSRCLRACARLKRFDSTPVRGCTWCWRMPRKRASSTDSGCASRARGTTASLAP